MLRVDDIYAPLRRMDRLSLERYGHATWELWHAVTNGVPEKAYDDSPLILQVWELAHAYLVVRAERDYGQV